MKATIEFDLDDPSDRRAHRRCTNATNAYIAFHDIDNLLRNIIRYDSDIKPGDKICLPEGYHTISEEESAILHQFAMNIRFNIGKILEENQVDMDDLE